MAVAIWNRHNGGNSTRFKRILRSLFYYLEGATMFGIYIALVSIFLTCIYYAVLLWVG